MLPTNATWFTLAILPSNIGAYVVILSDFWHVLFWAKSGIFYLLYSNWAKAQNFARLENFKSDFFQTLQFGWFGVVFLPNCCTYSVDFFFKMHQIWYFFGALRAIITGKNAEYNWVLNPIHVTTITSSLKFTRKNAFIGPMSIPGLDFFQKC